MDGMHGVIDHSLTSGFYSHVISNQGEVSRIGGSNGVGVAGNTIHS